jgi:DNA-directed RNA polymerase specialized sigma24 family protein
LAYRQATFEQAWTPIVAQVAAMCRAQARNGLDTGELQQRVMIRAWRGHQSFRGDSSYLTWVRQIITREASRLAARRETDLRREIVLDDPRAVTVLSVDLAADSSGDDATAEWIASSVKSGGFGAIVEQASRTGALTDQECRTIMTRLRYPELRYPDEPWEQLGGRLGLSATAGAVTHCRAVPKLRVFLFLHRPDILGGRAAIEAAFTEARDGQGGHVKLTAAEAEAFRFLVLDGRPDYRRRGWQTALRSACAKVAPHLAKTEQPDQRSGQPGRGQAERPGSGLAKKKKREAGKDVRESVMTSRPAGLWRRTNLAARSRNQ